MTVGEECLCVCALLSSTKPTCPSTYAVDYLPMIERLKKVLQAAGKKVKE